MTELLEQAFAAAGKLSAQEQDALAHWLLRELESENRWAAAFAGSQDALAALASQALSEHRAGATEPLDPDGI